MRFLVSFSSKWSETNSVLLAVSCAVSKGNCAFAWKKTTGEFANNKCLWIGVFRYKRFLFLNLLSLVILLQCKGMATFQDGRRNCEGHNLSFFIVKCFLPLHHQVFYTSMVYSIIRYQLYLSLILPSMKNPLMPHQVNQASLHGYPVERYSMHYIQEINTDKHKLILSNTICRRWSDNW